MLRLCSLKTTVALRSAQLNEQEPLPAEKQDVTSSGQIFGCFLADAGVGSGDDDCFPI